ncbi:MAG: STAS/SEC14 domain-containing protein [Desulfocapsa sp.]|nr:STAS/SEC14 domain-containing protein [Desulfocapsa sp.]
MKIDETSGIALLEPDGPLSKQDFESAATVIDPYLEKAGQLNGLVIHAESFPGWDSFAALSSHLKFVKEHHKKVLRVALATDSVVGNIAETVASHFVNAEIQVFSYKKLEEALNWAAGLRDM